MINQPLDTLAFYESKLDDNDSEKMLSLSGYKLVRRDRNKQGFCLLTGFLFINALNYHLKD